MAGSGLFFEESSVKPDKMLRLKVVHHGCYYLCAFDPLGAFCFEAGPFFALHCTSV